MKKIWLDSLLSKNQIKLDLLEESLIALDQEIMKLIIQKMSRPRIQVE
jgi:hypothetical protein